MVFTNLQEKALYQKSPPLRSNAWPSEGCPDQKTCFFPLSKFGVYRQSFRILLKCTVNSLGERDQQKQLVCQNKSGIRYQEGRGQCLIFPSREHKKIATTRSGQEADFLQSFFRNYSNSSKEGPLLSCPEAVARP